MVADILHGWGDITDDDTKRLSLFRADKVLAAVQGLEIPKDLKSNPHARTRMTQLRQYAANRVDQQRTEAAEGSPSDKAVALGAAIPVATTTAGLATPTIEGHQRLAFETQGQALVKPEQYPVSPQPEPPAPEHAEEAPGMSPPADIRPDVGGDALKAPSDEIPGAEPGYVSFLEMTETTVEIPVEEPVEQPLKELVETDTETLSRLKRHPRDTFPVWNAAPGRNPRGKDQLVAGRGGRDLRLAGG